MQLVEAKADEMCRPQDVLILVDCDIDGRKYRAGDVVVMPKLSAREVVGHRFADDHPVAVDAALKDAKVRADGLRAKLDKSDDRWERNDIRAELSRICERKILHPVRRDSQQRNAGHDVGQLPQQFAFQAISERSEFAAAQRKHQELCEAETRIKAKISELDKQYAGGARVRPEPIDPLEVASGKKKPPQQDRIDAKSNLDDEYRELLLRLDYVQGAIRQQSARVELARNTQAQLDTNAGELGGLRRGVAEEMRAGLRALFGALAKEGDFRTAMVRAGYGSHNADAAGFAPSADTIVDLERLGKSLDEYLTAQVRATK
jgi:hypothetical protein